MKKQVLCQDVTSVVSPALCGLNASLLEWYPSPRYSIEFLREVPARTTHIDEGSESAFVLECDGTIRIYELPDLSLLRDAVLGLDMYLNAGNKEDRTTAAEYAKRVYEKYHGVEYKNETER